MDNVNESLAYIESRCKYKPDIALVLGSGLGFLADKIENPIIIDYSSIPHFKTSTVESHDNKLVIGDLFNKKVLVMQGRIHYYEGFSQQDITYPIKVFKKMGIEKILLTNAAGGCNIDFLPGDIMIVEDHINFSGANPLIGENDEDLGPRFPDMSNVYDRESIKLIEECSVRCGVNLKKGTYMFFTGPSYETPAEIRMARILGADAVGMSTVPEAIVANYCGMKVLALSCISNLAAGMTEKVLSHREVIETADKVKGKLSELIEEIIINI